MLKNIFKNHYWHHQETNQAIVRLLLCILVTVQIGYGMQINYYPVRFNEFLFLAIAFNGFAVINLISIKYNPHSELRTYLSIPADVIGVSYAIILTDAGPFSPLFLLYPWMYVSYAVRYGTSHLFYIALSCILAFIIILGLTDTWYSHSLDAAVYLVFLIILPFYLNTLLKRIITEREEKERALKTRNEFLATMSHEIRTPMSGIIGMATLLERTNLNDQQKEYLSSLQYTSTVLHSLIDDVLDLSKLEANKTQLDLKAIDFKKMLNDTVQVFALRAKEKKLKLELHVDDIPEIIITDAHRLRQILLNLISNAIKFTQAGSITINVNGNKGENDIWLIRFEVIDTGSGIEHKDQHRVFEAFYQCTQIANTPHQGTGLGTAISKELVELMGGEIGLTSVHGKGSTFWFQLPLAAAEENTNSHHVSSAEQPLIQTPSSLNILLAEDNKINAKVITTFLEDEGHTVSLVTDGEQAIEKLTSNKYDMVFMDMRMPTLNGSDATKKWRLLEKEGLHTPIIALTANASPSDRELCIESGMDEFLIKPVNPEQLNNIIKKYI